MSFDWFPFTLGWELTLACNLRCKHCGSDAGQSRENELTTDEAINLCDQLPALLVQEVDFTGGEPLLRPDWPEIALRLRDHNITTGIVTNGTILDKKTIYKIKETGISHVAVSLDGLEQTHDFIRGKQGLFRETLKGIKELMTESVPITILTTVTELNVDELPDLFSIMVDVGVARWRPQPLIASGRVNKNEELLVKEDTFLKLIHFFQKWGQKAIEADLELLRADGLGYYFKSDISRGPWYGCPAGLVSVGITSDGKIKGCLSLQDNFIEGDLRQKSLWDIWFGKNAFPYTRSYSKDRLGINCVGCDREEQCRGGCTAMSYGYTNMLHNNPLCYQGIVKRQTITTSDHLQCSN